MFVPNLREGFFKFWWDQNLSLLKQSSVDSNRAWKAAGKPRQGLIVSERQSCRKPYRPWASTGNFGHRYHLGGI